MNKTLMASGILIILSFIGMLLLSTADLRGLQPLELLNQMFIIAFFFIMMLSSIVVFFYVIVKKGAGL